ncbi:site-2 protease family protein [Youxingia wuxianensis]|uniref:Site-2 protease family protein n=1 Tax=Youxingia wuxianensis TaxID=2763678 RepID=A0A926ELP8_9FIRM|nr:site-2 protease family protein [Youxingia wuxianensis]MBC8585738.1 site-2 protease family protein [Youxingia wuxianensis]
MGLFSAGMQGALFMIFARLIVLLTSMPIHEYAHGWVAHKLGDDTASYQGRLDFNPLAHLDPLGTILLLFTGFGWAKPVPVNPRNFSRKVTMRGGMALTSLAGPCANIILAFIILCIYKIFLIAVQALGVEVGNAVFVVMQILSIMITTNISLAVFNLLPIPPLDGYNILSYFIPARWEYKIAQYRQYIFIGLLAVLMFTNVLSAPLNWLANIVYRFLGFATGFIDIIGRMIV